MAYYAKIEGGIVTEVIVADSKPAGTWVQTYLSGGARKNYAGIGYSYDTSLDAFVPPKPFESWVLDPASCSWKAPIAMPASGLWMWDEEAGKWVAL